ncbi:MAG: endonuclease Q family protein [Treponema sp.]|jgi:uncharacterized protein (TIGR00375 family)|nr:endonuclease Q family protein [Treponema sp.]
MRIIADLHIHSPFSRAVSPRLDPANLERWARIKGIDLLGTGDCTHPLWLETLRENLGEAGEGLYALKGRRTGPRFVLTGEICTIYKKEQRTRKIHHLVILPDFKAAASLQAGLEARGNIRSDGRPVLKLDSRDLLELLLETDERAILIPAHIWTPWFSVLGAKSGFDSIDACYGDLASHIGAVETGLSSNPPMNWALASLDRFAIVSNSDAHSPEKLGREATVFDMELSYPALRDALNPGPRHCGGIVETIEFFPQEGKYHYDGHRNCGVSFSPEEAAALRGLCPVCGKALTRGVMGRVLELADRPADTSAPAPDGARRGNRRPYRSLIPLRELLAELLGTGAQKTAAAYDSLIAETGSEFSLLLDMPAGDIRKIRSPLPGRLLASAIGRMRRGEVFVSPGYDGKYGTVKIFAPGESRPDYALILAAKDRPG